ncbi:hypothetical protein [Stenomitos frigidus]|uniref:Uncharacterized protein n=1 Tax=Stenomitos frigidus ULC18 TaxID=2107698 RepID=A0A2T1E380_9CYAN|nr:hypothetical protein [Stenomitos frigidus]PSB27180.1 hypothetical protein C7B82_17030 [Stenomitos frigidus ULC18]
MLMSLDRRTGTLHTQKNEYYLEVEGLKYRIFEFDHGKVKADDKYGSAQLFPYQKSIDGFDGSVYAGSLQIETKLL